MQKVITLDDVEQLGCLCCAYRHNTNIYCKQELDCIFANGTKNMLTVDTEKYIIDNVMRKENKQMVERTIVTSEQIANDPCEYCADLHKTSDYCHDINKCVNAGCGKDSKFRLDNDKYCLVEVIEDENETDMVNHPKHYEGCSLECIDIMLLMFGADYVSMYCIINAYKYLHRHKLKNGLEDLKKAEWYLKKHSAICKDYGIEPYPKYPELWYITKECEDKANGK